MRIGWSIIRKGMRYMGKNKNRGTMDFRFGIDNGKEGVQMDHNI